MSLATLAVAIGMISWGSPLHAQTTPSAPTDSQAPQSAPDTQQPPAPSTPPQAQAPPQDPNANAPTAGTDSPAPSDSTASASASQTFSGTVVKQGDKYMLQDDSGKMDDIDHQTDVAKFEGKKVRVQGTLDSSGKKIMVK
jgi:uncharacterized protein YdeI (BOF family)